MGCHGQQVCMTNWSLKPAGSWNRALFQSFQWLTILPAQNQRWEASACSVISGMYKILDAWKWISTDFSGVRFGLCSRKHVFGTLEEKQVTHGFWIGKAVSHVSWSTLCLRMPPKSPACSATSALARHSLNWWDRAALNILKPLHFKIQTNTKISKSDQKSMHKNPIPQL